MPGRPADPLTDEQRQRILDLHADGLPRNRIAAEVGVAGSTVSKIVHRAGGTFDRTATAAATKARKIDARARRSEISALLLEDAYRLREQIWQPHEYIDHGGRDFTEARWTQEQPSPIDKLKLMQAASTALGRHIDIERHDADQGTAAVASMLSTLGKALGVRPPDEQ